MRINGAAGRVKMEKVAGRLVDEGVKLVVMDRQTWKLPAALEAEIRATLGEWADGGKLRRLWARDATRA